MPASGLHKDLFLQLTATSGANPDHIPHSWQQAGAEELQVSRMWNVNVQYLERCQAAHALGTAPLFWLDLGPQALQKSEIIKKPLKP